MDTEIGLFTARKQEILDAAKKLYSRKGYAASSMRDLAKSLGIKPASLYSHYQSKEEMLWEIAIRCTKEFHGYILPMVQEDRPVIDRLDRMLRGHLRMVIKNQDASAIFFHEWQHLEEPRRSAFAKQREIYEQAFIDVLNEGKQKGVFRDVHIRFSMFTLLSAINWVYRWYKPDGKMSIEEIEEEFSKLLIRGLKV